MHKLDRQKLLDAGYTILRSADIPTPRINVTETSCGAWKCWKKFDTKAQRDRVVQRILNNESKIIFD